jgi:hypothetical protein
LRLVRGQVTDYNGTALTIRDTLLRPSRCELAPGADLLATNGAAVAPPIANGVFVEAIVEQQLERCLIRTLYVRPPREAVAASPNRSSAFLDNLFPRGNLLYTGTVKSLGEGRLELRSRRGLITEFAIREDTTFSTGGRLVKAADLAPQTVVQVRAGRSFSGDLEVYQITWGGILPGR